jgi:pyridoxamine 5'-phosphate oxidase
MESVSGAQEPALGAGGASGSKQLEPDLGVRVDYEWGTLSLGDLGSDPVPTVRTWLAEAESHVGVDFNSMVLATVDHQGRPSTRNVLLRDVDVAGRFSFFSNRSSHKGRDIEANPAVSLLFSWLPIHRQLRVDGMAEKLDDALSDEYFAGRPRDSQVAAWASSQSSVIASRAELLDEVQRCTVEFEGREVPRPPNWGGYAVVPQTIEFWQGRPSRLHDRVRFTRITEESGGWLKERLAP